MLLRSSFEALLVRRAGQASLQWLTGRLSMACALRTRYLLPSRVVWVDRSVIGAMVYANRRVRLPKSSR